MNKSILISLAVIFLFAGCTNSLSDSDYFDDDYLSGTSEEGDESSLITDDGSTTNYSDSTRVNANAIITEDLY